jgi:hypothetical protein
VRLAAPLQTGQTAKHRVAEGAIRHGIEKVLTQ